MAKFRQSNLVLQGRQKILFNNNEIFIGQDVSNLNDLVLYTPTTQTITLSGNQTDITFRADGDVIFTGRDASDVDQTLIAMDPDGAVELYHNGNQVFKTYRSGTQHGILVYDAPGSGYNFGMSVLDDGTGYFINNTVDGDIHFVGTTSGPVTELMYEIKPSSITTPHKFYDKNGLIAQFVNANVQIFNAGVAENQLGNVANVNTWYGYVHGRASRIQAENNSGVATTLFYADPDGDLELYHAGSKVFHTRTTGIWINSNLELTADTDSIFKNNANGGQIQFKADQTNGSNVFVLVLDPDDAVTLYHQGIDTVLTRRGGITLRNSDNDDNEIFTGQDVAVLGDLVLYSPNNITLSGSVPQLDSIQNDINTLSFPNSASQTDITSVSAASQEFTNRAVEGIDTSGTPSGSIYNRAVEYTDYNIHNLTLPTSASQDDLRYEINNLTLPTSASQEDLDDIRYDLNTFTSPNSASQDDLTYEIHNLTLPTSASQEDLDDIRYDLNTFTSPNSASQTDIASVSAASQEFTNRAVEGIDTSGTPSGSIYNRAVEYTDYNIHNLTLPTSASQDDLTYEIHNLTLPTSASTEDLDDIRYDLNTFTSPNSASQDDLTYEIHNLTLPTSASTEDIDDLRGRLYSHTTSADGDDGKVHRMLYVSAGIPDTTVGKDGDIYFNTEGSVSGASTEGDRRLQEQIDALTITPSGSIYNRAIEYTDYNIHNLTLPTSASQDDLRYEINNLTLPTSASQSDILSVSGASDEADQRLQEQIDGLGAASIQNKIQEGDSGVVVNDTGTGTITVSADGQTLATFKTSIGLEITKGRINLGSTGTKGQLYIYSSSSGGGDIFIYTDTDVSKPSYYNIGSTGNRFVITQDAQGMCYFEYEEGAWYFSGGQRGVSYDRTSFNIGVEGAQVGALRLFSDGTIGSNGPSGGQLTIDTADAYDTTITDYRIQAIEDDLQIGPSTNRDSLQYVGGSNWWQFTEGDVYFGTDDGIRGDLRVYGSTTGQTGGGRILLYNAADYDASMEAYYLQSEAGNLYLGPITRTNAQEYRQATNKWIWRHDKLNTLATTADGIVVGAGDDQGKITVTDGSMELYHSGTKTFGTRSNGISVYTTADGHEGNITMGASTLFIFPSQNSDYVEIGGYDSSSAYHQGIQVDPNGAVTLFNDGTKAFATRAEGIDVQDTSGNAAYIGFKDDTGTQYGSLYIAATDSMYAGAGALGTVGWRIQESGSFAGYYNGNIKIETVNDGLQINGDTYSTGDLLHIGTSGYFEQGIGPSGDNRQPSGSAPLTWHGELYATKVYNAVWNDIADFQPVEGETKYGYAYFTTENGVRLCNARCQKGIAGISSDTYGYGVGMGPGRIPIAIGGWVLAHVDNKYSPGTLLTNDNKGVLTKVKWYEKFLWPERIVATYHRKEKETYIENVRVRNRHWVKVR